MVAKIAATGSGPDNSGPEDDEGRYRPRLLLIAAILVALASGGTLAWLLLSDNRLAGEPVVRIALVPEEPVEAAEPARAESPADPTTPATPPEETAAPEPADDADDLSPDEKALLDAARNLDNGLDKGIDDKIAAGVK
ncbi:MAG: hypothetical protein Q7U42_13960, partial [Parvibaculum sp.]|nr:hypothetical protein [Parvibaculum sp.]